jgi:hypothetical protein
LSFGKFEADSFPSTFAFKIFLKPLTNPRHAYPDNGVGFGVERRRPANRAQGNLVFLGSGVLIFGIFKQKAQNALEGLGVSELRTG